MEPQASIESPVGLVSEQPRIPVKTGSGLGWLAVWLMILASASLLATLFQMVHLKAGTFVPLVCVLMVIFAAWFDAATYRIPNALTYTGILVGLLVNGFMFVLDANPNPPDTMKLAMAWMGYSPEFILGFILCAGMGIFSLLIGGMGGGDVKLLTAMGALLGLTEVGNALLHAMWIGVLIGLVNLLVAGRLQTFMANLGNQFITLFYFHKIEVVAAPSRRHVPLAVPLLLGTLLARAVPLIG